MELIKLIAKYVVIVFLFILFFIWCFLDIKAVALLLGAAGIWVIAYVLYERLSGDHIIEFECHKRKLGLIKPYIKIHEICPYCGKTIEETKE